MPPYLVTDSLLSQSNMFSFPSALEIKTGMALDAVLAMLEKVGEYLVAPIGRQLGYVVNYNGNIEDLKKQAAKLEDERHRLQGSVDVATRNGEVIEHDVEKWLSSVEKVMEDMRQLVENEVQQKKRWHLDLCAYYKVGKKVKNMILVMNELCGNGKFDSVSHPAPPPLIFSSNTTYQTFESRIPLIKDIVEALKDDKIDIIGIYGMAGVGKTILVNEIGKQAKDHGLFDTIVMATISQTPSLKDIQGEIADMLGLKLVAQSLLVRAGHLHERLLKEKWILIILDDIWSRLDLEKVGIPSGCDHVGFKIILTSRNLDTCIEMDSQKNFLVEVLSESEAWNLFKKMAGDSTNAPDICPLAVEITKECAGLPIAIVTVARALKNRGMFVWKDALQQLKISVPTHINGMHSKVFSSLELSYNYLESEEAKTFFLLCCLFPEDSDIPIQEILEYGLGLGLFQNIDILEEARVRALTVAHKLKSSCLLLEGGKKDYVRMHDVVRDVALSIASKGKHVFLVRIGQGLQRWPKKDVFEQCTSIAIYSDEINELPDGLVCPNLQILSLACSCPSLEISGTFFRGLKVLKVLDLSYMHILSLPPSFCSLKNLRTLRLDHCELSNISMVKELKKLEILSLRGSDIIELPVEIGQLIHLRLLDLTECKSLKVIPPNVIASLSELEELYMLHSFVGWEAVGEENAGENRRASMAELKELSRLTALDIHIANVSLLPRDLFFESLLRFKISIGSCFWKKEFQYSKTMKLENSACSSFEAGIRVLLNKQEDLHLYRLKSLVDVVYDLNRGGFVNLKCLEIGSCCDLKYLVNTVEWAPPCVFPALERLKLSDMDNMKGLCYGNLPLGSFGNLKKLWLAHLPALLTLWKGSDRFLCLHNLRIVRVKNCCSLEYLFSSSIANSLHQLQVLDVAFCDNMKEVVANEKGGQDVASDIIVLPQLRFLKLQHLCKLSNFCSERNNFASEYDLKTTIWNSLFNSKVAFPCLEELQIKKLNELQQIWCPQHPAFSFCKLRTLRLSCCDKLLNAVPHNSIPKIWNLEEFYVGECSCLKCVFDLQGLVFDKSHGLPLSSLKKLKLQQLPILTHVWSRNPMGTLGIENLNSLEIHKCDGLRSLIAPYIAKEFLHLQVLCIDSCLMMEEIVAKENKEELEAVNETVFPQLKHLKLLYLPNLVYFYSGISALSWPSLEELSVVDCPKMKAFVYGPSLTVKLNTNQRNGGAFQERNLEQFCIFNPKVLFPNLNKLKFEGLQNIEIWHHQLPVDSFCKLKVLVVDRCDKLKKLFTSNFLQRLQHLEQLTVSRCNSLDAIFEVDEHITREGISMLPQLKELRLWGLPKLMIGTIYEGLEGRHAILRQGLFNRKKMIACPSLEVLRIEHLCCLNEIWHGQLQATIFSHLRYLAVRNCHMLRHIIPSNLLRKLYNLRKLVVENCGLLEEVIAEVKGDEAVDKLVFLQLATLELADLPYLKHFCSCSFLLDCPFLNRAQVSDCPKMETFSCGVISSPMLQKLSVGKDNDIWMEDLNNTIHFIFESNKSNERARGSVEENDTRVPSPSSTPKRRRLDRGDKKSRGLVCQGYNGGSKLHARP